ncbi:MAG: T9SS type A sorting domain-containing protein [Bacteroidetes bacterium]|nr:T9SS type A sorting domain-containing protein [Bacteroidota bacterium]
MNGSYSNIQWSTSATTASIKVNPSVTTTYSVTATDVNGCRFSDDHKVKIREKVSPVIQSSTSGSVCGSGSVTLSFTGTKIADQCIQAPYGLWPGETFSVSSSNGTQETITTQGFLGSYSLVNVVAGRYYNFVSSGYDKEIINLITSEDGTQVYAGGVYSAVWKATFTGKVMFITNGAECYFSDQVAITRSVACSASPSAFGSFVWSCGQRTASITVNPATTTNYSLSFIQPGIPCMVSATKQVVIGIETLTLTTTNIACNSATFNWSAPSNPTQWELEYKSTATGSKWINVPVTNVSARSVTVNGLKLNQNYQWHIRAKCGKSTTPYSALVLFKTLAGCAGSSAQNRTMGNATPAENIAEPEGDWNAVVMPNPSNTNFRIAIGGAGNLKEPVRITVTDIMGRVVETRTVPAGQVILIGDKYRSGSYFLLLTQGNKTKQLKLIKVSD